MITKSSILKDIPLETDLSTIFGMVKTVNGQFPDNNGNVNIKSENKEFTAFEVWATSELIPAGTPISSDLVLGEYACSNAYLSGSVLNVDIPASNVLNVSLKSSVGKDLNDIVIDFGDGTEPVIVKSFVDTEDTTMTYKIKVEKNRYDISFKHTYVTDGRYIVKIYGREYYNVRCINSILSRCLESDLPIASCVNDMSSFGLNCVKLISIRGNTEKYTMYPNIINWANCFSGAKNLIVATGIRSLFYNVIYSSYNFFYDCSGLVHTDIKLPAVFLDGKNYDDSIGSGIASFFYNCSNLSDNIEDLIPQCGFATRAIYIQRLFMNCAKLKGTVPAELLWNDPSKIWKSFEDNGTKLVFYGCSNEIKDQVIVAWGGNK